MEIFDKYFIKGIITGLIAGIIIWIWFAYINWQVYKTKPYTYNIQEMYNTQEYRLNDFLFPTENVNLIPFVDTLPDDYFEIPDEEKYDIFQFNILNFDEYTVDFSFENIIVIYFWNSHCRPCLKDLKKLIALTSQYPHTSFYFISDEETDTIKKYLEKNELKQDNFYRLSLKFIDCWIDTIPMTLVYDHENWLHKVFKGKLNISKLKKCLDELNQEITRNNHSE